MTARAEASSYNETNTNVDAVRTRSLLEVWEDWLYGYDFFVSYRWEDGREYAVALAEELRKDFSVFLDSTEYAIGDSLSVQGNRAVRKASRLVLVATPGVGDSDHVKREIRVFRDTKRRLLAIDFNGSFEQLRTTDLQLRELLSVDVLRVVEQASQTPSSDVIEAIRASLATETKRTKRRKAIAWACASLATLTVLAAISGLVAYRYKQYKEAQRYLAQVLHAKIDDSDQGSLKVIVQDQPTVVDVGKLVRMCNTIGTTKRLEITNSQLSGTEHLGQLKQLSYLNLYESSGIDSLAFVNQLSLLRKLLLYDTGISDIHLANLKNPGELEVIILSKNAGVSAKHIARILGKNQNLVTLRLYGCENVQMNVTLARAIKAHADQLSRKGKKFTIDIGKTAITKSSQDYESVLEVLQSVLKDGHNIEGLENPEPTEGFSNVVPYNRNVASCLWILNGVC